MKLWPPKKFLDALKTAAESCSELNVSGENETNCLELFCY